MHSRCCRGRGAVTWYPVHCTSINNTNSLISGDNKGVAAQFLEKWAAGANRTGGNGNDTMSSSFVGAFGQANVGDTSPNVLGAFCYDTGLHLEALHRVVQSYELAVWQGNDKVGATLVQTGVCSGYGCKFFSRPVTQDEHACDQNVCISRHPLIQA